MKKKRGLHKPKKEKYSIKLLIYFCEKLQIASCEKLLILLLPFTGFHLLHGLWSTCCPLRFLYILAGDQWISLAGRPKFRRNLCISMPYSLTTLVRYSLPPYYFYSVNICFCIPVSVPVCLTRTLALLLIIIFIFNRIRELTPFGSGFNNTAYLLAYYVLDTLSYDFAPAVH